MNNCLLSRKTHDLSIVKLKISMSICYDICYVNMLCLKNNCLTVIALYFIHIYIKYYIIIIYMYVHTCTYIVLPICTIF